MNSIEINPGERFDSLGTGDLKIIQSRDVFSFGLDAVLLAGFSKPPMRGEIVDMCSGNGAVALMLSAKTQAQITAIELQTRLSEMAERSVRLNQLENQISVINDDLSESLKHLSASTIDTIFCNPPYFKLSDEKNQNENDYLRLARHEVSATFEDVCHVSQQLLKPGGHLVLVHRPDRFFELIKTLESRHLAVKRVQFVYPKPNKSANLVLIDAVKDGNLTGEIFLPPLFVRDEKGNYTEAVREFYK